MIHFLAHNAIPVATAMAVVAALLSRRIGPSQWQFWVFVLAPAVLSYTSVMP
jgi:hypothetical protein